MKLCTLDDSILLAIFSFLDPLPDLFIISETCKRFRDLVNNQHAWIQVSKHHQTQIDNMNLTTTTIQQHNNNLYHRTFSTLQAAITSSRPGDTIVIKEAHTIISNIQIQWPLRLIGKTIADSYNDGYDHIIHNNYKNMPVLQVEQGSRTGLSFAATGHLKNLIIKSTLAPCVEHLSGTLLIDDCNLWCDTKGLSHLVLPITTNIGGTTATRGNDGDDTRRKMGRKVQKIKKDELIVSQCEFEKTTKGSAVLILSKKGRLQGARAIHLRRKTLLWFSVVVEKREDAMEDAMVVQHHLKVPPTLKSPVGEICPIHNDDDALVLEKRSGQWRHSIPTQCYLKPE